MTRTTLTRCDQQIAKHTTMTSGKRVQFIEVDCLPFKGPNNLIFAVKMCITKSARNLSNAKQPLNSPKQPHGKYRNNNYDISGSKIEFSRFKEYLCQMKSTKPSTKQETSIETHPASSLFSFPTPLAAWTIPINTTPSTRQAMDPVIRVCGMAMVISISLRNNRQR